MSPGVAFAVFSRVGCPRPVKSVTKHAASLFRCTVFNLCSFVGIPLGSVFVFFNSVCIPASIIIFGYRSVHAPMHQFRSVLTSMHAVTINEFDTVKLKRILFVVLHTDSEQLTVATIQLCAASYAMHH